MLQPVFVVCAVIAAWANEINGQVSQTVTIVPILKEKHQLIQHLASQMEVRVKEVIFGIETEFLKSVGTKGIKGYVPKGTGLYLVTVLTPDKGRCNLDFITVKKGAVDKKHALARCVIYDSVGKLFNDIEKMKTRVTRMIDGIRRASS